MADVLDAKVVDLDVLAIVELIALEAALAVVEDALVVLDVELLVLKDVKDVPEIVAEIALEDVHMHVKLVMDVREHVQDVKADALINVPMDVVQDA